MIQTAQQNIAISSVHVQKSDNIYSNKDVLKMKTLQLQILLFREITVVCHSIEQKEKYLMIDGTVSRMGQIGENRDQ